MRLLRRRTETEEFYKKVKRRVLFSGFSITGFLKKEAVVDSQSRIHLAHLCLFSDFGRKKQAMSGATSRGRHRNKSYMNLVSPNGDTYMVNHGASQTSPLRACL